MVGRRFAAPFFLAEIAAMFLELREILRI